MNMVFGIGDSINEDDNNYKLFSSKILSKNYLQNGSCNFYAKWLDNDK